MATPTIQPAPPAPKKKRLWLTLLLAIGIPVFVIFAGIITLIIVFAIAGFNEKKQTLATETTITQLAPHIISANYATSCDGFNCGNPDLKLYIDSENTDDVTEILGKVIPYLWHHSQKSSTEVVIFVFYGPDTTNSATGQDNEDAVDITASLKALNFTDDNNTHTTSLATGYVNFTDTGLQEKYGNR